jgi:hypothetical protein
MQNILEHWFLSLYFKIVLQTILIGLSKQFSDKGEWEFISKMVTYLF